MGMKTQTLQDCCQEEKHDVPISGTQEIVQAMFVETLSD
jgi:hypothetical protein